MELIPPDKWNHVNGLDNPADCASRGLFPSELLRHSLWWEGPSWLRQSPADWPKQTPLTCINLPEEERAVTLLTTITDHPPVISFDRYSSFNRLKQVTALILRFINNCRDPHNRVSSSLATSELYSAEGYWIRVIQETYFHKDLEFLISQDSPIQLAAYSHYTPLLINMAYFVSEEDRNTQCLLMNRNTLSFYMEDIQSPISSLGQNIFVSFMLGLPYWLLHSIKGTTLLEVEKLFVQSHVPV